VGIRQVGIAEIEVIAGDDRNIATLGPGSAVVGAWMTGASLVPVTVMVTGVVTMPPWPSSTCTV